MCIVPHDRHVGFLNPLAVACVHRTLQPFLGVSPARRMKRDFTSRRRTHKDKIEEIFLINTNVFRSILLVKLNLPEITLYQTLQILNKLFEYFLFLICFPFNLREQLNANFAINACLNYFMDCVKQRVYYKNDQQIPFSLRVLVNCSTVYAFLRVDRCLRPSLRLFPLRVYDVS